jgi:hypothetical protein
MAATGEWDLLIFRQKYNNTLNHRYSRKNTRLPLGSFSGASLLQSCRLALRYESQHSEFFMCDTEKTADLNRFLRLLPEEKGKDLTILKGHLLIEEVLGDLLKKSLKNSNPLTLKVGERMMFSEKLKFCWALNRERIKDEVWCWLKELNQIRNAMAHTVEPKGIDDRIAKLTGAVIEHSNLGSMVTPGRELGFALAWLFIIVSGLLPQAQNS